MEVKENESKAQSKVKQSKADQSKAKQSEANQSKVKQSKAEQSKAKQSEAKQSKAKQSEAKVVFPDCFPRPWQVFRSWDPRPSPPQHRHQPRAPFFPLLPHPIHF